MLSLLLLAISLVILTFSFRVKRKAIRVKILPKVSILVYAKNAGNVMRRRIENLLSLNYPKNKYEIIVYDNNSTDETKEICIYYAKQGKIKYYRVGENEKFFHRKYGKGEILIEKGSYDRKAPFLDKAIEKLAKNEILVMLDPDGINEKNYLLKIVQPFKDKKVGGVAGTIHCGNFYKNFFTHLRGIEDEWMYVTARLTNFDFNYFCGANYALRREVWEKTKHDNYLVEDVVISYKVFNLGYKIKGIDASIVQEEVEDLNSYIKQRVRWYKANIFPLFHGRRVIYKLIISLFYQPQILSILIHLLFLYSLLFKKVFTFLISLTSFDILYLSLLIGLQRSKTGRLFLKYALPFLTLDTYLFFFTAIYANTLGRKIIWPLLGKKYYHKGEELKQIFFKFSSKVKEVSKEVSEKVKEFYKE